MVRGGDSSNSRLRVRRMQASGCATVGGNVVAQPHLCLVVLPPDRSCCLVKVLPVETDAGEGVLPIAELGKG